MATDFASSISSWYHAIQFREPPISDLTTYIVALQFGSMTPAQVQAAILADPFTVNVVKPIIREFQAAFGRVPDQAGLAYWVGVVANDASALAGLSESFANSPEFLSMVGVTSPNQPAGYTPVFDMYLNVLNRIPDQAGLDFWVKSGLTVSQLLTTFEQSPEYTNTTNDPITIFLNLELAGTPATGGSLWQVHYPPPPPVVSGPPASQTFDLTTGIDTIVGRANSNTYNAILDNAAGLTVGGRAQTLNPGDTITGIGSPGVNILNVSDDGKSGWSGASTNLLGSSAIIGITTLNISSLEGIANSASPSFNFNSALDLTGWSALTALNVTASNNYYNIVSVGPQTAVSIVTNGSSSEYVLVFGGATIAVNNASGQYTYNYLTGGSTTTSVSTKGVSENYVYDIHNSANEGYDGGGTTPNWSAATNTIATFSAESQDNGSYNYIYSDALRTLNLSGDSYSYSYVYAAAGTRTLAVNLNNDGNSTAFPGQQVYIQDNTATGVTVTASGAATQSLTLNFDAATSVTFNDAVDLSFYNGATANSGYFAGSQVTSIIINGAGAFTADMSQINSTATINASSSTGAVTVELVGRQTFQASTGQNIVSIVANGANVANIISIAGLHNAGTDTLTFADPATAVIGGIKTVTAANVTAAGGSTSSLTDWIATAVGRGGIVAQSVHSLYDFQFGGDTYLVETVAASDNGAIAAGDTVVKLTGTSYTFANSFAGSGVLHLLG